MQVNVRFLDNLRLEASFDDFTVITDQPIRYKGDGTAPGPFDYFLASSALCAAYFVKVYCVARNIPTEDIRVSQNNIIDPEDRYNQIFNIQIELPASINDKDKEGILKAMDRCTVKKVIQTGPQFKIEAKDVLGVDAGLMYEHSGNIDQKTMIIGKDCSLEETILNMTKLIEDLGIKIEIASWRNIVPHVWSVHIRDADSPMCYTNGKGSTKDAALCSALGEYLERISNNYFYNDFYLGEDISNAEFVHYPSEKWFKPGPKDSIPSELMDDYMKSIYDPEGELKASHLIDTNSGNTQRGICSLPYVRQSDQKTVYIPVNLIGNLFVSNGMSAGNTQSEARVQALSEIFERAVKNQIIVEEIALPDVPKSVLKKYPKIMEGIESLEQRGFPILVKDASLGGRFPVMCVTLMNPKNGGVFASFGAHPNFEVALERSLTELLQGRSFEGLNDLIPPTFNQNAICEPNNIVDHFIDSTGVISWKFFSAKSEYEFSEWNFTGTTSEEFKYLMGILKELEKEVYIADYEELGSKACRILVPDYSEIYPVEELVWDNHNRALEFREDILNIHTLDQRRLKRLLVNLEESQIDDYTFISELIGIAFDENSVWGKLNIAELKGLTSLAVKDYETAKEQIDMLMAFNDNSSDRKLFFQALSAVLEITIERLDINDYRDSLIMMFGENLFEIVTKSLSGEVNFYGLTPTNMNLENQEKHQKLIASYLKLQKARKSFLEKSVNQ
ncbi:MAG: OsmC domain/YcaO domain-containing protein [Bdellovibrionales bacterium CG12_big_fil_rev_8_21_14_0_65_38_15]|nr:MAG: OsmC domain/YcaO domain-containing protein [Bdellovibrionales bacterium CG22_combo_CG10-13_8_21_14_all_38_13]PIQ57402.1 MAG: OsmC domain/YcaO domain-containing protein [Bdellovibrionales bacterium CG12_big_fil_rev_8_21_14_0_65_38_15]PIR31122.1 MAG: OsmC domain/YcaO domain-containing protein [Bdellovibrionales bacterium CG11_big_fil_rev_8_21_14_0_20_38_13]